MKGMSTMAGRPMSTIRKVNNLLTLPNGPDGSASGVSFRRPDVSRSSSAIRAFRRYN